MRKTGMDSAQKAATRDSRQKVSGPSKPLTFCNLDAIIFCRSCIYHAFREVYDSAQASSQLPWVQRPVLHVFVDGRVAKDLAPCWPE